MLGRGKISHKPNQINQKKRRKKVKFTLHLLCYLVGINQILVISDYKNFLIKFVITLIKFYNKKLQINMIINIISIISTK